MDREIILTLRKISNACIQYVGSDNYPSRERAALAAMERATTLALDGNLDELKKVAIQSGEFGDTEHEHFVAELKNTMGTLGK